jgi:hypothetical protein
MIRMPAPISRWIARPNRHHWLPDTRDPEYSAGRLMRAPDPRP